MVAYLLKLPYEEYVSKVKKLLEHGDPVIEEDFPVFNSTAKEGLKTTPCRCRGKLCELKTSLYLYKFLGSSWPYQG